MFYQHIRKHDVGTKAFQVEVLVDRLDAASWPQNFQHTMESFFYFERFLYLIWLEYLFIFIYTAQSKFNVVKCKGDRNELLLRKVDKSWTNQ